MKKSIFSIVGIFAFALALQVSVVHAEEMITTTSVNTNTARMDVGGIQALIKSLTERIKQLQGGQMSAINEEVKKTQEEIKEYIKTNMRVGTTSDQVRHIQEVLASDASIYPRGLVTGYFGPMTEEALKKFQEKFNLEVTGEINEETREAMNALLEKKFGEGSIPQGLLGAPGMMQVFEMRLQQGCADATKAQSPFCIAMKAKHNWASSTSSSTVKATLEEKAEAAIESAEDLIDQLTDAIEAFDGDDDDLDDAENRLSTAESRLEAAKEALDDEAFSAALRRATGAATAAKEGLRDLDVDPE